MASAEELERGMFILVNKDIYKILRREVVTCGTHSHSKTKLFTQHIEGGGEKVFTFAHKDRVEVLDIENRIGQVIAKNDASLTVMDTKTFETLDVEANPDILNNVQEGGVVFFFTHGTTAKALKVDRETSFPELNSVD